MTSNVREMWWWISGVVVFTGVVTWLSFSPPDVGDPGQVALYAKSSIALLAVATAGAFAYADSDPSSQAGETRESQVNRRDRAKLAGHAGTIGIGFFVFLATVTGQW